MVQYISKLLSDYDCVILPNLGGIVSSYEPATKDLANAIIHPPSKSLAFNVALQKNDGLLQNFISQEKAITFKEAQNEIEVFVEEVKRNLKHNNIYVLPGIGKLVLGQDKHIEFFPFQENNFNLSSYGLPSLSLVPVSRLKKTTPAAVVGGTPVGPNKEKSSDRVLVKSNSFSTTYFRVAAVVGALFLMTTMVYHTFIFNKDGNIQEASFLSTAPIVKEPVVVVESESEVEELVEEVPEDLVVAVVDDVEPVNTYVAEVPKPERTQTLRIIVGSFGEQNNAERYAKELKQLGYDADVLPGPNGFSRVCIFHKSPQNEYAASIQKIRNEVNPNAWLLD